MTDQERKERDLAVIKDWIDWHESDLPKTEQIKDLRERIITKFNISQALIYEILERHSSIILARKERAKLTRIFRLEREIAQKEKSNKDVADLIEQLRKEYEGDKPLIDNSKHITSITYGWQGQENNNPVLPATVSNGDSRISKEVQGS